MSTLKLRPYQDEAVSAVLDAWHNGVPRPAVVFPTGMGKTVVFSALAEELVRHHGARPAVLVHRDELVRQTVAKLQAVAPELTVGVIQGPRNELGRDVTVASVQTLSRSDRLDQTGVNTFSHLIVDECHHATAPSYRRIMDYFPVPAVGFTATMARADSGKLGDVWDKVVCERDILDGIAAGYLCDVRGRTVQVDGLDLDEVARSRGDWQDGALGQALEESDAAEAVAQAYREHAKDRRGVLFAPTVASAGLFAQALDAEGIACEAVFGGTPAETRQAIYARVRAGDTQVLVNCMVLTEGFDMPELSCAVIARPTQHASLYTQMVGRVLRPFPGKADALVLDVAGVAARHRLATLVDLSTTTAKIEMLAGESLADAAERVTEARERVAEHMRGEITWADVDLFGRSKSAWLMTPGGVWFVPTRERYWFVYPDAEDPSAWRVGATGSTYAMRGPGAGWKQSGIPSLELAMAIAERSAADEDGSVSSRTASWRQRSRKVSEAQIGMGARIGLVIPPETSKSEASDMISTHLAGKLLDRGGK
jgi:superfamily II DNA or RNA helicase